MKKGTNILSGLKNSNARLFDYKNINADHLEKNKRTEIIKIIQNIRSNIAKLRYDF